MMCQSCCRAADESRKRHDSPVLKLVANKYVKHRCEYPVSCTCQHAKIKDFPTRKDLQ
jgi:hypothetical protein